MDADRFDMIAKTLTTGRSRRGALGLLAGAAGLAVGSAAAAGRRGKRGGVAPQASESEACYPAVRRACSPGAGRNHKNCDFSGQELGGLSFSSSAISGASFAGACAQQAKFNGSSMRSVCMQNADLAGANFRGSALGESDFTGANVCGADFLGSSVQASQLAVAIGATCCSTRLPNGKPGRSCPAGETCCGADTCTDLNTDAVNCGACGRACGVQEVCVTGRCVTLGPS